ncbi:MAG: tetratricopeptide repeat protein [Novosphingobium sp.]
MALRPSNQSRADQLAERNAAQQEALLREVDDALREDKFMGFLQRHGIMVAVGIVLALGALGGYLWWDHSQTRAAGERGEQFTVALDRVEAGHLDSADKQLQPLASGDAAGTSAAARLMRAGIALEQGRQKDAVRLFGEVATDTRAPQPFRDLATIRQVAADFDAMAPEQVVARLKPLAAPGNPWFGNAGELLAIAYLKQGKPELAGPLFASIAREKDAPESLRRRARQMAGVLGVDAVDDPEKIAKENADAR